jgi:plastocyanin
MTSADKFGIAFAIGFTAVMIGLISAGTFSTSEPSFSQSTQVETYSPPPKPIIEESAPAQSSMASNSENSFTTVLSYNIRGGIVEDIIGDSDNNSVDILIDSRLDGQLTITITSSVVQSFDDGSYFVLVDDEEVHDFTQNGSILTIPFLAGTTEISILGINDDYVEAQAADKAAADKAAADKAAADKAAADKAAADKAAADKAAALPMSVSVENATGSSSPGCEPNCFIPNNVTVAVGGTVSFVNSDTAPHTSTSGSPSDGPSGVWDSSLVMPGATYDTTISSAGTYDYFCMVHPWMTGTVIAK